MYYCILSEAKASLPVLSLSGSVISVPWMLTFNQSKQEYFLSCFEQYDLNSFDLVPVVPCFHLNLVKSNNLTRNFLAFLSNYPFPIMLTPVSSIYCISEPFCASCVLHGPERTQIFYSFNPRKTKTTHSLAVNDTNSQAAGMRDIPLNNFEVERRCR